MDGSLIKGDIGNLGPYSQDASEITAKSSADALTLENVCRNRNWNRSSKTPYFKEVNGLQGC